MTELTRRLFGSLCVGALLTDRVLAQATPRRPDPNNFESGDLIWPKKPGALVPYRSEPTQDPDDERIRWNREKSLFLERIKRGEVPAARAAEVEHLSYSEFRARYLRDLDPNPNQIVPFAGGGRIAAVGHVGIIEIDAQKQPWVIEALVQPGVVRQPYSSWLASRPDEIVWHGRLKEVQGSERAKIPFQAKKYISKPYDFWNFDLSDESGFYCSKLVWLSIMQALRIAVDGNLIAARSFWLSPKQVLYSQKIERLLDPGEYATD